MFGPRSCGKITLLRSFFQAESALYLDLLDPTLYDQLILEPQRFLALIDTPKHRNKRIIIDEIQRIPRLLDVIHSQIQATKKTVHYVCI